MHREDVVHVYNEILLSHEKEWNNAICSNGIGLEIVLLSKVSQTEKEIYPIAFLICGIWKEMIQMSLFLFLKRNSLTDLESKFMIAREEGWGEGIESLGWTCTHCYI